MHSKCINILQVWTIFVTCSEQSVSSRVYPCPSVSVRRPQNVHLPSLYLYIIGAIIYNENIQGHQMANSLAYSRTNAFENVPWCKLDPWTIRSTNFAKFCTSMQMQVLFNELITWNLITSTLFFFFFFCLFE